MSLRWRLGLAALAGALGACGLAPLGLWPLTALSLVLVPALFLMAHGWRQAAWTGWAFGTGWFGHGLIWIVEPFLVDVGRHGWMAPFALILMAGGLALFWAAAFGAAYRLGRGPGWRIALLILFWSLAEFGRAYLLTGFPWAGLAQAWSLPQTLAAIGPHGTGLWALLWTLPVGGVLAHPLLAGAGRAGGEPGAAAPGSPPARRPRSKQGLVWAVAALFPGGILTAGVMALRPVAPVILSDQVVRVVQPNAAQHLKWDPAYMPVFFQRALDYTAAAPKPDLIIWPESAVPVFLHQAEGAFARIAQAAGGVPVIVGIQRYDGTHVFNSLVVLDAQGAVAGVYDKHHLVPFGEYMPLAGLADRLGLHGLAAVAGSGYQPGPGPQVMSVPDLPGFLPLICYEAVFPQDVNGAPGRPGMLVQITNDAWFGARSGPYQHLEQARMRAVEQGLPMIRAANTGISGVIDPAGQVLGALPLGQAGYLDLPLPRPAPPTPYARMGDGPVFLLLLMFALCVLLAQTRGKRAKPH